MDDARTERSRGAPVDGGAKLAIERLATLTGAGGERAAAAFAQLAGRPIRSEAPLVVPVAAAVRPEPAPRSGRTVAPGAGADDGPGAASEWCTGVFFELDGCVSAIVGILFPGRSSETLVRRIVGIEAGEVAPPLIESALMEVGNILASHVASAIADALSERLLPSIPSLAMSRADVALLEWIEARGAADGECVLCVLRDEAQELEGRLVVAPAPLREAEEH